jgi:hypothetical protein
MSEPDEGATADNAGELDVPPTGDPAIDDALRGLDELRSAPLAEHHDQLARAHEALHVALQRSGDDPDPS